MRLKAVRGRWWPWSMTAFLCVLLAVVVFVGFEALDLDGSNQQRPSAGAAIGAESASTALEELQPPSYSVPAVQGRVPPCLDHRLPPDAGKHFRSLHGESVLARLDQARPRSLLRREPLPPMTLSDEPT
jgi:hypothetical protein